MFVAAIISLKQQLRFFLVALSSAAICGQVAQLVEQRTENPRVGGSTPSLATISPPRRQQLFPPGLLVGRCLSPAILQYLAGDRRKVS
jgi:hypothetical protein